MANKKKFTQTDLYSSCIRFLYFPGRNALRNCIIPSTEINVSAAETVHCNPIISIRLHCPIHKQYNTASLPNAFGNNNFLTQNEPRSVWDFESYTNVCTKSLIYFSVRSRFTDVYFRFSSPFVARSSLDFWWTRINERSFKSHWPRPFTQISNIIIVVPLICSVINFNKFNDATLRVLPIV